MYARGYHPNEDFGSEYYSQGLINAAPINSALEELRILKDELVAQANEKMGRTRFSFKSNCLDDYIEAIEKAYRDFEALHNEPTNYKRQNEFNLSMRSLYRKKYLASLPSALLQYHWAFIATLAVLAALVALGAAIAMLFVPVAGPAIALANTIACYSMFTAIGSLGLCLITGIQQALHLPNLKGSLSVILSKNTKQAALFEYRLKQEAIQCSPGYKDNHTFFSGRYCNDLKLKILDHLPSFSTP